MANTAKSYATAIYELDKEQKSNQTIDDLKSIVQLIKNDEKLQKFLNHPVIQSSEKKNLIASCFKNITNNALNLMYLLLDNNCSNILENIIKEYQNILDEEHKILHVEVITATKLTKDVKDKLTLKLEKYLQKQIVLEEIIDKNYLGGIVIKYQGKVLDNSLLQKQEDLKEFLLK